MKIKKSLLLGFILSSVAAFSSYIDDAARLLNQGEIKMSDLKKDFTLEDIKKIEAKSKELKINELKEKKEKEKEQEEKEKSKKLEEIKNKQKKEDKDTILISDLEKTVNHRFEKLEKRVSNLEKGKNTNVNTKNAAKAAPKVTTESKKNPKVSKTEAIQSTIRGKYGDGEQRKETLKKLGFTDKEIISIQKEVNRIIETDHIKVNLD